MKKKFSGRKRYDEGGSVMVDSEGVPVKFGYESDEEYEKRAGPIMTDLQMKDVSPSRAKPSKTRGFLNRLFIKPFKEYDEFDEKEEREKELTRLKNKAKDKTEEASRPIVRPVRLGRLAKGGSVGSASKRADGIAQRGKTRGKMC